jgi:hypothetical protein
MGHCRLIMSTPHIVVQTLPARIALAIGLRVHVAARVLETLADVLMAAAHVGDVAAGVLVATPRIVFAVPTSVFGASLAPVLVAPTGIVEPLATGVVATAITAVVTPASSVLLALASLGLLEQHVEVAHHLLVLLFHRAHALDDVFDRALGIISESMPAARRIVPASIFLGVGGVAAGGSRQVDMSVVLELAALARLALKLCRVLRKAREQILPLVCHYPCSFGIGGLMLEMKMDVMDCPAPPQAGDSSRRVGVLD